MLLTLYEKSKSEFLSRIYPKGLVECRVVTYFIMFFLKKIRTEWVLLLQQEDICSSYAAKLTWIKTGRFEYVMQVGKTDLNLTYETKDRLIF
jgi:hypothetical protein